MSIRVRFFNVAWTAALHDKVLIYESLGFGDLRRVKLDHPRQLSLMHALVRFSHLAAQDSFSTAEVHADTAEALGRTTTEYTLGSLRYDLSKLRAKGLVQRLDKSRRYRLTADGYRICVVYLKLFEKLYAPLTSAILKPFRD